MNYQDSASGSHGLIVYSVQIQEDLLSNGH